ncbi:hypothetical protein C1280_07915 [Gemmata obscuriglobus]|uniref:Peptidase C14 caspase domain-containing protein n=2 Tax=Gemmata obscuriglobus TaxID=114 RepID=A0A2Z3GWH4_9BACT|nr:hypothetical protein C1280_07915 [Gemmata obscuriglobus]
MRVTVPVERRRVRCPECGALVTAPGGSEEAVARKAPGKRVRTEAPGMADESDDRPRARRLPGRRATYAILAGAGVLALVCACAAVLVAIAPLRPRPPAVAGGADPLAAPNPPPVPESPTVEPPTAPNPPAPEPPPVKPPVAPSLPPAPELPSVEPTAAPVRGPASRPKTPPNPLDPLHPYLVLDANGHTAQVQGVAMTPDGRRVVTASRDRTVRVWDVTTGETLRTFRYPTGPGNEGMVQALALSPDGRLCAAAPFPLDLGQAGRPALVTDMETGRVVATPKGHRNTVTALAYSPDGRFLGAGSGDHDISVWDARLWKPVGLLRGHSAPITGLSFSPNGLRSVSVAANRTALLWSGDRTQKPFVELRDGDHQARSVAWSPDGRTVAVGNHDGTISLWNPDGTLRKTLTGLRNDILNLAFTPDSHSLLQCGVAPGALNRDRFACTIIDAATGEERSRFEGHTNLVSAACLSADGALAVTAGGNDHEVHVWRVSDGSPVQTLAGRGRAGWTVGWSPDGRSVAWGNSNARGATALERAFELSELRFAGPPNGSYSGAVLTRGGRTLELTPNREMAIKNGSRTELLYRDTELSTSNSVFCFTWLPDGRIVVGSQFGLQLFDPDTNQIVRSYAGSTDATTAIALSPDARYFATTSGDMIIRVWRVDQRTPVLSLFCAGSDWVAWTQEGLYAASPNGERLMGWQVNTGGATGLGTAYSAAQFRKSLYRPDVIGRVLRDGGAAAALERAGVAGADGLQVARLLPPAVALTSPSGLGVSPVAGPKFAVKASAQSVGTHPVTALRLLVNGRPYGGASGVHTVAAPRLGEVRADWSVELPPGLYNLAVVAESAVSRAVSPPVGVQVGGPTGDERPTLYLLAVGISDYPGPMKLNYAAADADALARAFKAHGKGAFRAVEVKLIRNKEATRGAIEQGLGWLSGKMTHRDVGVVFFSGHGGRDEKGNLFLITADVDPKNIAGTCLPGDAVKRKLGGTPGRVIAILDACHSGAAADRPTHPSATDDLVRDLVSEDYGIVVMSSSQGWEYSLESAVVGQGFFTAGLIDGLSGKADTNGDGFVYLNELATYAAQRVRVLSDGSQNPVTAKPPSIRSFPLSKP